MTFPSSPQPRIAAGVPAGGQFSHTEKAEATMTLDMPADPFSASASRHSYAIPETSRDVYKMASALRMQALPALPREIVHATEDGFLGARLNDEGIYECRWVEGEDGKFPGIPQAARIDVRTMRTVSWYRTPTDGDVQAVVALHQALNQYGSGTMERLNAEFVESSGTPKPEDARAEWAAFEAAGALDFLGDQIAGDEAEHDGLGLGGASMFTKTAAKNARKSLDALSELEREAGVAEAFAGIAFLDESAPQPDPFAEIAFLDEQAPQVDVFADIAFLDETAPRTDVFAEISFLNE